VNVKFNTISAPLEETNAAWRAAFWLRVFFLWLSSPIAGVGFSHDFYDEDPLHLVQADHYDPHNSYLAILARTGAVGLLLVVAASFFFLRLLIRLARRTNSEETSMLGTCLLSCFVAIGTFAAANVTLESPYFALFFWLFIGMGVALAESEKRHLT
jgi:O-antigen ligase